MTLECLVVTPHRYGIKETAERIGIEWGKMGHSVDYILEDGGATRFGGINLGVFVFLFGGIEFLGS